MSHMPKLDPERDRNFSFRALVAEIAEKEGVTVAQLLSRTRKEPVPQVRWKVFAALNERGWSLPMIARRFGMNHTSVLYGLRRHSGAAPARAHMSRANLTLERTL
jgi:chromosomal replication initiation ATPase DnaA